jgi:hypothetical protein
MSPEAAATQYVPAAHSANQASKPTKAKPPQTNARPRQHRVRPNPSVWPPLAEPFPIKFDLPQEKKYLSQNYHTKSFAGFFFLFARLRFMGCENQKLMKMTIFYLRQKIIVLK